VRTNEGKSSIENILRKIGFGFLIAIAVAAVLLWQYSDRSSKQDVLEQSLDLLGKKLLAMVPDGNNKAAISEVYDNFKEKAITGLLGEREVEQVAANILNASNRKSELTPQQAETILAGQRYAADQLPDLPPYQGRADLKQPPPGARSAPAGPPPPPLGSRILTMVRFNDQMLARLQDQQPTDPRITRHMRYRADAGLRVELDKALRLELTTAELQNLQEDLKALEEVHLAEWRENLAEEIDFEIQSASAGLDSLHLELQQHHHVDVQNALREIEQLRQLEGIIPINIDSLKKVIQQSIDQAGMPPPPK
jgi:hypothetical protein